VRGRDLGSTVLEAQRRIADEVQLPASYRLEWAGEFGNLQDAVNRLKVIVPLTIVLIGVLLYVNFASLIDTLLGIAVIPMAMIGGTGFRPRYCCGAMKQLGTIQQRRRHA
jgi:cobalt-zinc-cadmium resistance protein CzcA